MKRRIFILITLIIVFFIFFAALITANNKEIKNEIDMKLLYDVSWTSDQTVLYFGSNGHFAYYGVEGSPVDDYDLCNDYKVKDNIVTLNCDYGKENLEVVEIKENKLIINIKNKLKTFRLATEEVYVSTFDSGIIKGLSNEQTTILKSIKDLNSYIKNNNSKSLKDLKEIYDEDTFDNQALLIVYVETDNKSEIGEVIAKQFRNSININYSLSKLNKKTKNKKNGYLLLIEVNKEMSNIKVNKK